MFADLDRHAAAHYEDREKDWNGLFQREVGPNGSSGHELLPRNHELRDHEQNEGNLISTPFAQRYPLPRDDKQERESYRPREYGRRSCSSV